MNCILCMRYCCLLFCLNICIYQNVSERRLLDWISCSNLHHNVLCVVLGDIISTDCSFFKTMIFLVIMIFWKKHFRTLVFKISWGCKITTIATNRCKLFEIFVSVIFFSFLFSSVCALVMCVKICIYICNMGYCNFKSYSSLQSTGLMELPKISNTSYTSW